ncbi:MAG: hypothetical protein H6R18_531 [Proteobacteria bacterium]|nr:hypothetical protein [Pseudomonadota bacterium]
MTDPNAFVLPPEATQIFIDAGIANIRMLACNAEGNAVADQLFASNQNLQALLAECKLTERLGSGSDSPIFLTGKLAPMIRQGLGCGKVFMPAAALWLAAKEAIAETDASSVRSLAMVEISASGYMIIGLDREGQLKDDLLITNPRCGAGTGVNLDRVLQKLGLKRDAVDNLLAEYLGEAGKEKRQAVLTRADRCGVFSSSATISDKNQGIPLSVALATTLKSEVQKTMQKLPKGFDHACLIGRIFRWQFARDCAEDCLAAIGITAVDYDTENSRVLKALHHLVQQVGITNLAQPDPALFNDSELEEFPAFAAIKAKLEGESKYLRLPDDRALPSNASFAGRAVNIGLDVGSTMAKVLIEDDESGEALSIKAYSNSGDTVDTVKNIFQDIREQVGQTLKVRAIGITGSARFQVKEALTRIYPALVPRTSVLVENYAHAHGSIDFARAHLGWLKERGIAELNEDFCILVDIGGEDTKVSTIALREAELFNNAMNLKCSAGTGSLMDTLSALFGLKNAGEASKLAYDAAKSFSINATCAVFLMENAQKLQAEGVPRGEILASANWAIVENMARSLWNQVDLPPNTVVLLHGQTMLSDPLPLAVTSRLQSYLDAPSYALVPPFPGHRACFGLVRVLREAAPAGSIDIDLPLFIESQFEKKIIQCKGLACGDESAVCNRTSLKCRDTEGKQFIFTLGGCSAINERMSQNRDQTIALPNPPRDSYKEIWDFIDARLPKSDDHKRLVIARSFCVSEWAGFIAAIFQQFKIPVHVDNVNEYDLVRGQPQFNVDTCAPHIGAVGQFMRLAEAPHGMILVPQIEMLPTEGKSMGRTCTLNQGGVAVANNLAKVAYPNARFHSFTLMLSELNEGVLCDLLYEQLRPVFKYYGRVPLRQELEVALTAAIAAHRKLKQEAADFAADLIEEAQGKGQEIAVVVGREYILTPGIYDSHIRRLLRDKRLLAIPSYVLDVELDEEFRHIYWRNPHAILTILNAVAHKNLHQRLKHPRLKALFEKIENNTAGKLLPVVQISTFTCGPDSVISHLAAEIMKKRPFLLIQSDAIIKELAHLENRVNTYVRQLELGLHEKLSLGGSEAFEVKLLDELENKDALNPATDAIYIPTLADNRVLTSVLRGAGFTCIDTYHAEYNLEKLVKRGRAYAGDSVCAPLAAVYGDLLWAMEDFARRKEQNDPLAAGKTRLLYFNNKGTGPCRQGQYVEVHKLLAHQITQSDTNDDKGSRLACGGSMQFLVANESNGYNFGLPEWAQVRIYQGAMLQAVLQDLHFRAASVCRNTEEYQRYHQAFLGLKEELYAIQENFRGPGKLVSWLLKKYGNTKGFGQALKFFGYRMHGKDLAAPIARFTNEWPEQPDSGAEKLNIFATGEVYMRIAMAEQVFRNLLANMGFGRFHFHVTPLWCYAEYLIEEEINYTQHGMAARRAKASRCQQAPDLKAEIKADEAKIAELKTMRSILRDILGGPIYKAAGLPLPTPVGELMDMARTVLPNLRPAGELAPYVGEVLHELEHGADVVLNIAPSGCMVSTMGEALTPRLMQGKRSRNGRIQHLFSAEGELDDELLTLAVLKTVGPERYFRAQAAEK